MNPYAGIQRRLFFLVVVVIGAAVFWVGVEIVK